MAHPRLKITAVLIVITLVGLAYWYAWAPDRRPRVVYPTFYPRSDVEAVIERLGIVTPTADADSAKKLKHTVELSKGQTFHLTGQFASGVKFTKPVQCFLQVQFFVTDSTGKEEIWATGGGIPEVNPKDPTDVRFDIPVSAPIQSGRCQFRLTNLEYHILVLGEANIR